MTDTEKLISRLNDEADQCRHDGADDIALLLDEAASALASAPMKPSDSSLAAPAVEEGQPASLLDSHLNYTRQVLGASASPTALCAPALRASAPIAGALGPSIPDEVMLYVHAYGDSRADDDGLSGLRIGEAILAIRRWVASVVAQDRARDQVRSTTTEGRGPQGAEPGGDSHAPKTGGAIEADAGIKGDGK